MNPTIAACERKSMRNPNLTSNNNLIDHEFGEIKKMNESHLCKKIQNLNSPNSA